MEGGEKQPKESRIKRDGGEKQERSRGIGGMGEKSKGKYERWVQGQERGPGWREKKIKKGGWWRARKSGKRKEWKGVCCGRGMLNKIGGGGAMTKCQVKSMSLTLGKEKENKKT
jgi:hypothetical protein